MAKPDGTSSAKRFIPPYLRADLAAEKKQIDADIRATIPLTALPTTDVQLQSGAAIPGQLNPRNPSIGLSQTTFNITDAQVNIGKGIRGQFNVPPDIALSVVSSPRGVPLSGSAQKSTATQEIGVTVIPAGTVPIGWFCETEFRATLLVSDKTWCSWYIESGSVSHYLGSNYGGTAYFLLNGQSYYLYQTNITSNTSTFRIRCDYSSMPVFTRYSDYIHLNYQPFVNNNPCVALSEASFVGENWSTEAEVVGNNHGARPRLRVVLNNPAGLSGQLVTLLMDDPHDPKVGRWLGNSYFTIPYKQTSIEVEGIIGTRAVTSKKTMSIRVRVNGVESGPLTIKVKRN